ncbi:MAG: D-sedoheptulose 7-phosphate isomerase [Rhodospirillales bacterium]|nr:D-sedoheptulose 7-phosphate isomerase [Alphaproteobacteria bacterium]MCB9981286.1 D-sedoheptulose 7-phosphate isomerase [Rhodospirillales bacterium]
MTTFNIEKFWASEAAEHQDTFEKAFATLQNEFEQMLNTCTQSIENGGKILFFGNGGSASDAQHLATELTVRYVHDRRPIPAIALTTDTSALTAIGNDYGFNHLFSRQIEALGGPGDVAIAISTSGSSENILHGLKMARKKGLKTIGLSGRDGGKMPGLCDTLIIIPSNTTARIQEMHILLGHMLCGALEKKLNLVE